MMPEAQTFHQHRIEMRRVTLRIRTARLAHGGLAMQDRAILLTPRALAQVLPTERIEGADRLYAVLVSMLRAVGQRKTVPEQPGQRSSPGANRPTDS